MLPLIRPHAGAEPARRARVQSRSQGYALAEAEIEEGRMTTVWVYVDLPSNSEAIRRLVEIGMKAKGNDGFTSSGIKSSDAR